jgi:hypothetical protein
MVAAAPPPLDIHGFVEGIWSSTLINPQGQVLGTHGAESVVAGLNWTVWHGNGFINSWVIGGLVAADWIDGFQGAWALGSPEVNGHFFDLVGQASTSVTFLNNWTLREAFTMVVSQDVGGAGSGFAVGCAPAAGGGCSGFAPLPINQLRLSYSDASWGWPVTFNPYVEWYYNFGNLNSNSVNTGGQTPACFTCGPNKSDFFVGITPTWNASKWWGVPLTLQVPTYITVGPSDFWTGGAGNAVGTVRPTGVVVANDGNFGVFTTGLTAIWDLKWIPSNYGGWYIRAGFQFYDLINKNLRLSENQSVGCDINTTAACKTSQNIWVGFAGVGVHF